MAQINRSNIPSLLRPGLKTVFGNYNTYPDLYKEIYNIYRSDKATEYDMEMQGLGLAQIKQDGSPITMGSMQQGYITSYLHQFYVIDETGYTVIYTNFMELVSRLHVELLRTIYMNQISHNKHCNYVRHFRHFAILTQFISSIMHLTNSLKFLMVSHYVQQLIQSKVAH